MNLINVCTASTCTATVNDERCVGRRHSERTGINTLVLSQSYGAAVQRCSRRCTLSRSYGEANLSTALQFRATGHSITTGSHGRSTVTREVNSQTRVAGSLAASSTTA